jgi:hypothetical protein
LPTIADYAAGMPKARSRKPIAHDGGQGNKTGDARNELALTAESALPPKKPPAPSVKHRLRRAKLMK